MITILRSVVSSESISKKTGSSSFASVKTKMGNSEFLIRKSR